MSGLPARPRALARLVLYTVAATACGFDGTPTVSQQLVTRFAVESVTREAVEALGVPAPVGEYAGLLPSMRSELPYPETQSTCTGWLDQARELDLQRTGSRAVNFFHRPPGTEWATWNVALVTLPDGVTVGELEAFQRGRASCGSLASSFESGEVTEVVYGPYAMSEGAVGVIAAVRPRSLGVTGVFQTTAVFRSILVR